MGQAIVLAAAEGLGATTDSHFPSYAILCTVASFSAWTSAGLSGTTKTFSPKRADSLVSLCPSQARIAACVHLPSNLGEGVPRGTWADYLNARHISSYPRYVTVALLPYDDQGRLACQDSDFFSCWMVPWHKETQVSGCQPEFTVQWGPFFVS